MQWAASLEMGERLPQVTDITVHPHYQKLGYGRFILETIQSYILQEISNDAFVCLFAEKEAAPFYQRYEYRFSHEQWPGMYWPCAERQKLKTE